MNKFRKSETYCVLSKVRYRESVCAKSVEMCGERESERECVQRVWKCVLRERESVCAKNERERERKRVCVLRERERECVC